MIFAHGPWWAEWHHLLLLVPAGLAWWATHRASRKGGDK